ncbi:MAG: hypothetical protein NVSMB51_15780 [Solirubrobacteraceae bacterium]
MIRRAAADSPGHHKSASVRERLSHAYEAAVEADFEPLLACCDVEVAWTEPQASQLVGGTIHGLQAVREQIFARLPEIYREFSIHAHELQELDDERVLVFGEMRLLTHHDERFEADFVHVWRFRRGLAVEFRDYHDRLVQISALHRQLATALTEALDALAGALGAHHRYTAVHASSTGHLAAAVALRLELGEKEIEAVRLGAMFHDIGKIGVPVDVLNRRGALTDEEWQLVRRHPEIGAEILQPMRMLRGAAEIVRHHHERWDGSGYPDGLAGAAIPLGARIVAAVDAWAAMRSDRSYRAALTEAEARDRLRAQSGTQFDPEVVEALLALLATHSGLL